MCGIVGFAHGRWANESISPAVRQAAIDTLRHRGPDASGQFADEGVWLAHRRLSILDLSPNGNQPMQTGDGRFVITYNGEVYNFRELARDHHLRDLRSHADTEVVLRLFAEKGVESLIEFNGMFAFAVYDSVETKLWLVRDRMGIKPLYYRLDRDRLVFASEIKAIEAIASDPPSCDPVGLHEWLYYGTPLGDRTLFTGIRQLLPGHYMEVDLDSMKCDLRPYWSLGDQVAVSNQVHGDRGEIITETRRLLEQAVQRQLVSDVPVGVFLSGGIDSSAIVAFASRHYGGKLRTYSAGFDFASDGGELPKAKRIAERYGTDHHEIHIAGGMVGDLIERLVRQHDMPFGDAANIPLFLMSSEIGQTTKVVLQGDGGDELFGGYRRYATLNYYRLLHAAAIALDVLSPIEPRSVNQQRFRRYVGAFAAADLSATMALLLTLEDRRAAPAAIFGPGMRRAVETTDPFARFRECLKMFDRQDISNQMSLVDLMIVLPDTYLQKVDRSTMAASLEVRVPFLDHDLIDYTVRVPGRQKMPWGQKKWLLKQALRGVVPSEVLDGPKLGLTVPFGKWLQGDLKPMFFDYLDEFGRSNPDVLDIRHVTELFELTSSGRQNHSYMLWKIFNFMIWARTSRVRFPSAH